MANSENIQSSANQLACIPEDNKESQVKSNEAQCKYQKKRGSKQEVFEGIAEKTGGGLSKDHLMVNKKGKIISKKRHEHGLKAFDNIKSFVNQKNQNQEDNKQENNEEQEQESKIEESKAEPSIDLANIRKKGRKGKIFQNLESS